jgi:L-alanine-DL-glutamate epimerase-like enolase superfamily enzyme
MKITQVVCQILRIPNIIAKTASSQDSVLVRVRTDDGLEGVGEADSSPEGVKAIIDAPFSHNIACGLRHLLVGENPLDHERLWQKMYRKTMYFGRKALGITAMAAVDMALWDLKGRRSASRSTGCSAASSTTAFAATRPSSSAATGRRLPTLPASGWRRDTRL